MPWTNASIVLNGRDRANASAGNYNNANFNANGQNIIQGQIHSISLNEVNFPYDIPNVQGGGSVPTNNFVLTNLDSAAGLQIVLGDGFYNGAELESAINVAIGIAATGVGEDPLNCPNIAYHATENLFSWNPPAAPPGGAQAWVLTSGYTFSVPNYPGALNPNRLGKDLPSIMGFLQSQGKTLYGPGPVPLPNTNALYIVNTNYSGPSTLPPNTMKGEVYAAQSAPLTFTQYIDICSPQLCKGQRFRDGSTTNLARRSDVICRLYISNNVATQEEEGMRPFVINRQFNNARVMKWTTDNSVGTIDIQLYDDCGQPLSTSWQPRPYQITFNCYEQNTDTDDTMLSDHLKSLIGGAASYL